MNLGDRGDDGQTEPGTAALSAPRCAAAVEALKEARHFTGAMTSPSFVTRSVTCPPYGQRSTLHVACRLSVAHGVVDEVVDKPVEEGVVAAD